MKQYIDLLKTIKEKGVEKGEARENMPTTISLFGYQFRHDLQEGFPLLTTKKLNFKNIVVELLWFLRGDTNIKFLIDNGCNIWNEDAYNYYIKLCRRDGIEEALSFSNFLKHLKGEENEFVGFLTLPKDYTLGDCGKQYGALWRSWQSVEWDSEMNLGVVQGVPYVIDQVKELIDGLIVNPMSRRHIITAWNPSTLDQMALNACHALVQFNCRPIPWEVKLEMAKRHPNVEMENLAITEAAAGNPNFGPIPQYYLDCQMYQRSADVFLGVPYNIASYALLTHILAEITGMVVGDFIHTFGDVHIYSNHLEQVDLQISRDPKPLPTLHINSEFWNPEGALTHIVNILDGISISDFEIEGYEAHPIIKGKLSTGLI